MWLVMTTTTWGQDYNADADYMALQITPELTAKLERLMALAKEMKAKESTFLRLELFDYSPLWLPSCDELGELADLEGGERVENTDCAIVASLPDVVKDMAIRQEYSAIQVADDGAYWRMCPKHCSFEVSCVAQVTPEMLAGAALATA